MMNKPFSHIAFENASADVSCFDNGTASNNNKGEIMYPKDIVKQTRRMWENGMHGRQGCQQPRITHILNKKKASRLGGFLLIS